MTQSVVYAIIVSGEDESLAGVMRLQIILYATRALQSGDRVRRAGLMALHGGYCAPERSTHRSQCMNATEVVLMLEGRV
jgi:hypothetical protein